MGKKLLLDQTKLMWHPERVDQWLDGKPIAPITIDMALTQQCNYRCVYCYAKLQRNVGPPLSRDTIFRLLDDAADGGVKAISFVSDGESTLHRDLWMAITYGAGHGIDMALGTNGLYMKPQNIAEAMPALTYIRFNISAAEPERYSTIHGCPPDSFHRVLENIRATVLAKKAMRLNTTIGLQMVFLPEYTDQVLPLVHLGRGLGVDYTIIKHCSDDEEGSLRVNYSKELLKRAKPVLKAAEALSTEDYQVHIKWSKLKSGNRRPYKRCLAPAFQLQFSGSGVAAPCGMFFHEKYAKYHFGSLHETRLKAILASERYRDVLHHLASSKFDARKACGCLCLQDAANRWLNDLIDGKVENKRPEGEPPPHVNFV